MSLVLVFLSSLGPSGTPAMAKEGWYVIGNFGQRAPAPPAELAPYDSLFEEGEYLSGVLGFGRGAFRAEGQFLYAENPERRFDEGQSRRRSSAELFALEDVLESNASPLAVMANGFYDYSVTPRWRLFAGAGLGVARLPSYTVEDPSAATTVYDTPGYQNSDTHFAYQGMLGLSYQINDPFEVFVGYRFFGAENLGLSSDYDRRAAEAEGYAAHSGLIGFRYNF